MKRQLYAAVRRGDQTQPFMKQFIVLENRAKRMRKSSRSAPDIFGLKYTP